MGFSLHSMDTILLLSVVYWNSVIYQEWDAKAIFRDADLAFNRAFNLNNHALTYLYHSTPLYCVVHAQKQLEQLSISPVLKKNTAMISQCRI